MVKYVKRSTGYNLFCSTVKVQDISRYGQMWKDLSDEERIHWRERAQACCNEGTLENLSDRQKKSWRTKYLKQLNYTCKILEKLGVTTAGIYVCDDQISTFGTEKGKQIFGQLNSQQKAMLTPANHPKNLKVLQRKVQAIFNEKYSIALGKKRNLSYKNCNVSFVVNGLPEGVRIKKPSYYGINTCRRIIAGQDAISVCFLDEKLLKLNQNSATNGNSTHQAKNMIPESEPHLNVSQEIEVQLTDFPDTIFQLVKPSPSKYRKNVDKEAQKMVKDLFNEKYSLAFGKKRCVSYKNFKLTFDVDGLPDGIPFKKPSYYGKIACRKIISAKDAITFRFFNKLDSALQVTNSAVALNSQKFVPVTSIVNEKAKTPGPQVSTIQQDTSSSCQRLSRKRVWKTIAIPLTSKRILYNPPSSLSTTDQPSSSTAPPSGDSVSKILALLDGRLRNVESQLAANNSSESTSASTDTFLSLLNAQQGPT